MIHRRVAAVIIVIVAAVLPLSARSVGGGISVWVPESMPLVQEGTVGVETSLGSSLGLGDNLSLPFGLVYNKVYALLPEIDGVIGSLPWFFAETLTGHLMAKARLPIGPLYLEVFGGVGGLWNIMLVPLTKNIEREVAPQDHLYSFQEPLLITNGRFGWGWQAGSAVGVTFDRISVGVSATYRLLTTEAGLRGIYADVAGGTVVVDRAYAQDLRIRFGGFSIGLNGSYEL
jgi:hypothetical protein